MNTSATFVDRRVTAENHPPRIWQIPICLRRRLSNRVGRQRAIAAKDHLVMVLHRVPDRRQPRQPGVYFWRSPEGVWSHSEQGAGFAALSQLVQDYEDKVVELESVHEHGKDATDWFEVLDAIGAIVRPARNLHEALSHAHELSSSPDHRAELQVLCDQTSEIEHAAEQLQTDVQNSIQYMMARQSERQADFVREQSRAAHRLNILAAIFLPTATLSSIFGMNLQSGLEEWSPFLFWLVMSAGLALGVMIGIVVMRVKAINPNDW